MPEETSQPAQKPQPEPPAPQQRRIPTANPIVSKEWLVRIAALAARAQGVDLSAARAPRSVTTAVRELNDLARLATGTLAGHKGAEAVFRQRLDQHRPGHPGLASRTGHTPTARAMAMISGTVMHDLPCLGRLGGALQVLDATFLVDFRSRDRSVSVTHKARSYLSDRMGTVDRFVGTIRRGQRGGIGDFTGGGRVPFGGGGTPFGPDDLTDPILPGGGELPPGGKLPPGGELPMPDGGLDPSLCEQIGDLCMTLYEEAASAWLNDPFIDLIVAVEPNCVCHDYDLAQEFTARSDPARPFPDPLPTDVRLYYRGIDITANIISANAAEIRFHIPANEHSGFVYLRGPFMARGGRTGDLGRVCGFDFVDLPEGAVPEAGPVAVIHIIYPPVIDWLAADGHPGPNYDAEGCQPVDLCWRAHLSDQPPHFPLPDCARIEVVVRDEADAFVAQGGRQGCFSETRQADRTYTAVARSFIGDLECGVAEAVTLTVHRTSQIHLIRDTPTGSEIIAGRGGSFYIEISCPAPEGGLQVQLAVSDTQSMQLPASADIPANHTRVRVDFTTVDNACGEIEVTAQAPRHTPDRLRYRIIRAPVIDWAVTAYLSAPPPVAEVFQPFQYSIHVDCIPVPDSRLAWKLIRTDAGGQGTELALVAHRPGLFPNANWFLVSLPADAASQLVFGTWAIVAEVPDLGFTSNRIEFGVRLCRVDVILDSVTVISAQNIWEGGLDLSVQSFVTPNPPPLRGVGDFRPIFETARWPDLQMAEDQTVGEGDTVNPGTRIATYLVDGQNPSLVDVLAVVRDHDSLLQLGDDIGTGAGQMRLQCDAEQTLTLDVMLTEDVTNIEIQLGEDGIRLVIEFNERGTVTDRIPDGTVQLVYKTVPRAGM